MGGGGGFVDFDGDGWLDVYLVVLLDRARARRASRSGDALYRNNGDGTFSDVTERAGIRGRRRGMGLAVADYDGDGRPRPVRLRLRRERPLPQRGRRPVPRGDARGPASSNRLWGCSATFLDYDRDGRPDLFVSNYLEFDPSKPGSSRYPCELIDDYPFCTIARFEGQPSTLYRNRGDGTFEDASAKAGIAALVGKGMGVVAADLDDDGWVDLFQTNDSAPNFLLRNLGDGRFKDVALEAEVAFDPSGRTTGAMATDAEDVDEDGRLDLVVTNFNNQGTFLQRNNGGMRFSDRGNALGLGMSTFRQSSFGARFLDYDDDGDPDLFIAAGHPFAPVAKVWPEVRYADPPFLFENEDGRFTNVAPERGEALRAAHVGRGVAVGDFDNDGDPDVLLLCVGEPPRLLRNDGGNRNHWLGVRLVGHGERTRRDRRARGADGRRAHAGARTRRGRQLPHGLRSAAAVRARRRRARGLDRGALAERPASTATRDSGRPLRDAHRGLGEDRGRAGARALSSSFPKSRRPPAAGGRTRVLQFEIESDVAGRVRVGLLTLEGVAVRERDSGLDAEVDRTCATFRERYGAGPSSEVPGASDARTLYKALGIDPTKTRPSNEALLRRALKGEPLYRINTLVDALNLVSLREQLPFGLYDLGRVEPPVRLRKGAPERRTTGSARGPSTSRGGRCWSTRKGPSATRPPTRCAPASRSRREARS